MKLTKTKTTESSNVHDVFFSVRVFNIRILQGVISSDRLLGNTSCILISSQNHNYLKSSNSKNTYKHTHTYIYIYILPYKQAVIGKLFRDGKEKVHIILKITLIV